MQATTVIETQDETHNWLIAHYIREAHNIQSFEHPNFDIKSYDELLQYLINSKDELKRDQYKMLSTQHFTWNRVITSYLRLLIRQSCDTTRPLIYAIA